MSYTIDEFWKPRLRSLERTEGNLVRGWEFVDAGLDDFVEAPLGLSEELNSEGSPGDSQIILVSAPGAVGKTTLAKCIAHSTGAVYIDLAQADPVGGNALAGGLVKSGMYAGWEKQTAAVVIDGLDEARFRVTQESFVAFLEDIAKLTAGRRLPTILFGRTGAIQETYIILDDINASFNVLEIGYFDLNSSLDFVMNRLKARRRDRENLSVERSAAELILQQLREQTEHDGDRFAGYAPVLESIANHINSYTNSSVLLSHLETGTRPMTLSGVVEDILEREAGKLRRLQFEDQTLPGRLYLPGEQLDHLVARLYATHQVDLPDMGAADAEVYRNALDTWLPDHPFLNGEQASTAVFDAVISAHALQSPGSRDTALRKELSRGRAANPFLSEFYPASRGSDTPRLPLEHVGVIYASYRSRLSIGDSASLVIEGKGGDESGLCSSVEITVSRSGALEPMITVYDSDQSATVHLGAHVEDVEITNDAIDVCVGGGSEVVFVAPVDISCSRLCIDADKIVVERSLAERSSGSLTRFVELSAKDCSVSQVASIPVVRRGAELMVSWPGAANYPWTGFEVDFLSGDDDSDTYEALRRLRRFIVAFRAHGRGALARFRGKIEHRRMIKGPGRCVLDQMLKEHIVYLKGPMYFLDPNRLKWQAGVTFYDASRFKFGDRAKAFVERALESGSP